MRAARANKAALTTVVTWVSKAILATRANKAVRALWRVGAFFMGTILDTLKASRKIVVKLGSGTLAKSDGTLNTKLIESIADQCCTLIKRGKDIVIVSSGAQVSGVSLLHEWARKRDEHFRQALCAIGQVALVSAWEAAFNKNGRHVGQLLLVKADFENNLASLNIRNTLFTLVDEGVIPVINENDSVSFEEDSMGDNDNLSALVSVLWGADALILLSDIDGVYTSNPKVDPDAKLIENVTDIEALEKSISTSGKSNFGTGGVASKINAAKLTTSYNIPLIVANGSLDGVIAGLFDGTVRGTLFE